MSLYTDKHFHLTTKTIPPKEKKHKMSEMPPWTQTTNIILTTPVNHPRLKQRKSHIPFFLDSRSELYGIENPSFEIMLALTPIAPAKILQTGRDSGFISQINLQVAFSLDPKILKCVHLPLVTLPHTKKNYAQPYRKFRCGTFVYKSGQHHHLRPHPLSHCR